MSHTQDDPIETLLRKQFDGPASDEGFSERLMKRLPQRRRRVTWPLWFGIVAGTATCWLALLSSPLPRTAWREWAGGEWSAPAIMLLLAMLGMAMLASAWGVAEADDH